MHGKQKRWQGLNISDWCRFPPLPLPIKWATQLWFSRRHKEAWEFGPVDLYGNPRDS